MGKDRFARHTLRFADVPRQPGVYLAELTTSDASLLKVGVSGNLQGRLMSLQSEAKREHAAELSRFFVIPKRTAKAAYEAETQIVRRLGAIGRAVEGRREFFVGVPFGLIESFVQPAEAS